MKISFPPFRREPHRPDVIDNRTLLVDHTDHGDCKVGIGFIGETATLSIDGLQLPQSLAPTLLAFETGMDIRALQEQAAQGNLRLSRDSLRRIRANAYIIRVAELDMDPIRHEQVCRFARDELADLYLSIVRDERDICSSRSVMNAVLKLPVGDEKRVLKEAFLGLYDSTTYFEMPKRTKLKREGLTTQVDRYIDAAYDLGPLSLPVSSDVAIECRNPVHACCLHLALEGTCPPFKESLFDSTEKSMNSTLESRRVLFFMAFVGGLALLDTARLQIFPAIASSIHWPLIGGVSWLFYCRSVIGRSRIFRESVDPYIQGLVGESPFSSMPEPASPFLLGEDHGLATEKYPVRRFFIRREIAVMTRALRLFGVPEERITSLVLTSPVDERLWKSKPLREELSKAAANWGVSTREDFITLYRALQAIEFFRFEGSRLCAKSFMREKLGLDRDGLPIDEAASYAALPRESNRKMAW